MGTKMSVTRAQRKDFWRDMGFIISVIQKTPLNLFIKKSSPNKSSLCCYDCSVMIQKLLFLFKSSNFNSKIWELYCSTHTNVPISVGLHIGLYEMSVSPDPETLCN